MPNPQFESIINGLIHQQYAVCHDFIPQTILFELHQRLQAHHQQQTLKAAGIGQAGQHTIQQQVRGDAILWLDPQPEDVAERAFTTQVEDLMRYLNRECYMGLSAHEFHYAYYAAGTFYKRHLDQFKHDDARKLSVITYLNPTWQAEHGGELVIYLKDQPLHIPPKMGTTVIFKSNALEHEVLCTQVPRLSLTGWIK